ncbi:MAG: hypothetical protein Q8Q39_06080 [bacterium]|nr:hypothetical protein [bacterium]
MTPITCAEPIAFFVTPHPEYAYARSFCINRRLADTPWYDYVMNINAASPELARHLAGIDRVEKIGIKEFSVEILIERHCDAGFFWPAIERQVKEIILAFLADNELEIEELERIVGLRPHQE